VVLLAGDGLIQWANRALAEQVGLPLEQIVGRTLDDLPIERVERDDGVPVYHVPRASQGSAEWLLIRALRLPDDGPGGLGVAILEDVTQVERFRRQIDRMQQALHGQVSTDEVTGLLNRRGVMHQLEAQVSRSRRYHNVLSVVMMRLRWRGGGATPEPSPQALLSVARLVRDQTRWPDIIAHWGEGDFVLVLPETSEQAAGALTAKLGQRIAELYAVTGRKGPSCSIEFGVAEWQSGDTAQSLLERAAGALQ
jgi:GGDEF domain-containing protein